MSSMMSPGGSDVARLFPFLDERATVIYDGECPFCSRYAELLDLRRNVGEVRLLDARSLSDSDKDRLRNSFNLDEGMIFAHEGKVHYGADAVHRIAELTSGGDVGNRVIAGVFHNRGIARALYPLMRAGRRLALALKGSKSIHDA
ncbi:DCC1-like thiol-disulfide oxidoreductase family protein [Bosea vestrisii]|uniref:DCC1-like thiol-disulfide oxidoreductase family protein n=1 Tax=Bosea vestrisii TaxID=151416 RepID=A0ABW0H9Z8_9HYPH|nr:hypothetical protein [Methylobacterium sp.]